MVVYDPSSQCYTGAMSGTSVEKAFSLVKFSIHGHQNVNNMISQTLETLHSQHQDINQFYFCVTSTLVTHHRRLHHIVNLAIVCLAACLPSVYVGTHFWVFPTYTGLAWDRLFSTHRFGEAKHAGCIMLHTLQISALIGCTADTL